jgi:outer membrane protein insertion porin family
MDWVYFFVISLNKGVSLKKLLIFFSLIFFSISTQATPPIKRIVVDGNQRIEEATILNYLDIEIGDVVSQERINENLRNVFESNYFADVNIKQVGEVLLVSVSENPSINRVVFEGNDAVSDKILEAEVKLSPRMILTRDKVQKEVQRILAIYRAKGHFGAKVNPEIIRKEQNRVDIDFDITEGPAAEIRKINFVGNKKFGDNKLKSVLLTSESAWWKFFSSNDVYDPDRLEVDRDNLRKFYLSKGYADFRVVSAVAELVPTQDAFIITFTIEEGPRYKFAEVDIESDFEKLKDIDFKSSFVSKKGDWYSATMVERDTEKISDIAGDYGYAFVNVRPVPFRNEDDRTISIKYRIEEGPKVYINHIKINGNTRTVDKIIRRQFQVAEGDAFSSTKLKSSDRRIQNLGFFKTVDIKQEEVQGAPDKVDVITEVKEQSTGEINFSIGYSSLDGPLGSITLKERNLFGRAYAFGIGAQIAKRSRNFNISLADPYFLNKDLEVGVGAVRGYRDQESESSYKHESIGGRIWMAYALAEYWGQRWTYSLTQDKIGSVKSNASSIIREQEGKSTSSIISHSIIYDRRDLKYAPTEGYVVSLNNNLAGAGGNVKYYSHSLAGAVYYTPIDDVTASFDAEFSIIDAYDNHNLRIIDKFTLGGSALRGYEYSGVSPREKSGNEDAVGGDRSFTTSAEVTFPLGLPNEVGLRGSVFVDAGTVWDSKLKNQNFYNDKSIRVSSGFGLGWSTPMGLIRLDFGFPVVTRKGDKEQRILLNFGTGRF